MMRKFLHWLVEFTLHFFYEDEYYEKFKGSPLYVPGTKYEAQIELHALSKPTLSLHAFAIIKPG